MNLRNDENEIHMGTSPESTHAATTNLLPAKSKDQYERAYKLFIDWRRENQTDSFSENVLLAYFENLSARMKPSSLWATYSMLRMTINIKNNIDVSKYRKLRAFLKRTSDGHKPKTSRTLTPQQISEFLSSAPDENYLFTKVGLIFGIMGVCRREELMKINTTHVEDLKTALLIHIPDTKTNTERQFVIGGNFYNICKKYIELRPPNLENVTRFFLNYQQGKCTRQPIGINKFGSLASQVATFLKLPNPGSYTGHWLRRSSATILVDSGADITALKCHGGCRSTSVAEGHFDHSINDKIQTADKILHAVEDNNIENTENINVEISKNTNINIEVKDSANTNFEVKNSTTTNFDSSENTKVIKKEKSATANLVPAKSKNQYERAYKLFIDWRRENQMNSFSENVLLTYFQKLSARMKSSSLWATYSMLRMTINLKNNIDVSRYCKLRAFLKRTSVGHKPKKSRTLTPQQIREFLSSAPDDNYLFTKVGLIFGIMGMCRREELMKINTTHVEDLKTALLIHIPDTKTKTERQFVIGGNFYNICKKYIELRPPNLENVTRFFLNYQQGKCTRQPVGINKFGSLASQVATFLKLPNPSSYTGRWLRRSSAAIFLDSGADSTALKCHRGWHSTFVAEGYLDHSINNKIQTANKILHAVEDNNVENTENINFDISKNTNNNFEVNNSAGTNFEINDSTITNFDSSENTKVIKEEKSEISATANLLPAKSKNQYERAYKLFIDWRQENQTDSFSENVLLTYFHNLSARMKPSSLWATYSMLRMTINLKNNIDVSKYPKLRAFLKRTSDGHKPKKSRSLTPQQIREFLSSAPDENYLFTKVGLIFGIMGMCRREELTKINTTHVEDLKTALLIHIPDTKTKTERQFVIGGNFYNICKKYIELRPPNLENVTRFFLNYQQGKCTRQPVGINKFGSLASQVATFLKLPNPSSYTGHWLRRSSATILVDSGADITALKCQEGWRSTFVAESYFDHSINNKIHTADKILHAVEDSKDNNVENTENINVEISKNTSIYLEVNNSADTKFDVEDSTVTNFDISENTEVIKKEEIDDFF